jgi:beta-lactamase regulating signal transducer with metallopeptidase domain
MKSELLYAGEQILAAATNGIYQGILLAVVVWFVLRLCARTNAATKHAIWFATLLLVVSLIPLHLLLGCFKPVAPALESAVVQRDSPVGSRWLKWSPEAASEVEQLAGAPREPNSLRQASAELSDGSATTIQLGSGSAWLLMEPEQNADPSALTHWKPTAPWANWLRPLTWNVAGDLFPRTLGLWFLVAWLCASGLRLAILLRRLGQIRRLKTAAWPANGELGNLFEDLRRKTGCGRRVQLAVASSERSPVLLGFVQPVILLPPSIGKAELKEAEHILRHELAHVARWDDWANLAQHLLRAAFFFHPAVHWISRWLSLEREIACDDWVINQGGRPRTYALLLADLAGRIRGPSALLAPGVSANKSQLQQRITMILDTRRNISPRLAKARLGTIVSAATIAALLALYSAPRLVLAQTQPAASSGSGASTGNSGLSAEPLTPEPPTTPAPAIAQLLVAAQPTPDVPRGPKTKPGSEDENTTPLPPTPPATPAPAGFPSHPVPPVPPAPATMPPMAPAAPCLPVPTRAPVAAYSAQVPTHAPRVFAQSSSDESPKPKKAPAALKPGATLEERLERLERMVESLRAEQNAKRGQADAFVWKWSQPGPSPKAWDTETLEQSVKRQTERAAQQVEQAERELKRAAEAQARASKRDAASAEAQKRQAETMRKGAYEQQVEAVKRARESLQRELERLDRQIERLQRDREHLDKQNSSELEKDVPEKSELLGPETVWFLGH